MAPAHTTWAVCVGDGTWIVQNGGRCRPVRWFVEKYQAIKDKNKKKNSGRLVCTRNCLVGTVNSLLFEPEIFFFCVNFQMQHCAVQSLLGDQYTGVMYPRKCFTGRTSMFGASSTCCDTAARAGCEPGVRSGYGDISTSFCRNHGSAVCRLPAWGILHMLLQNNG